MRPPKIGITCASHPTEEKYYIVKNYVKAVGAGGGIPFLVPPIESETKVAEVIRCLDGILLSGGKDLDPKYYGEEPSGVWRIDPEKDVLELALTKAALERDMPILGICRGCQVLNVVGGGTLSQNLSAKDGKIKHWQTAPDDYPSHGLEVKRRTKLFGIVGKERIRVNSFHHQAIKDVARGYKISAVAPDGTIEGIESVSKRWVIGVQFHAEYLWEKHPEFKALFVEFVRQASGR
ncbi:hypothetical protein AMJ40_00260 [candidate division TA06 bacterium DG_26]|uniref:Uncharacterized protein n=1 Tax=candidate division TA06 bacterium DG_26 TaxID=1703771 RepID=A0A0S7WNS1_UNCT6|nr:MAG: hypothetical protein AMJ40_00260 [candidate division TA06 bacterium DG_26]